MTSLPMVVTFAIDRSGYRFYRTPSLMDANSHNVLAAAKSKAPLFLSEFQSVMLNPDIAACIRRLCLRICPPAIIWTVWAVTINAIKAWFVGRFRSHVGVEILKRVQPSVTHHNSTLTIDVVSLVVGIVATILRRLPRTVFWASLAHAMCSSGDSIFSRASASAIRAGAAFQCEVFDSSDIAATTSALMVRTYSTDDRPLADLLALFKDCRTAH